MKNLGAFERWVYFLKKKKNKKNEILMWHFHKSCDCLNPQNAWKLGVASVTRTS